MRNRINGKQLNRKSEHRKAMLKNMASGLFEHGSIETTMPKAKAVQPFVEKLITIAKQDSFQARRQLESKLNDRKIHAWVADPNVPDSRKENPYFDLPSEEDIKFNRYGEVKKAPRLVQHILTNVAPRFADRDGGYTRIIKTGRHRLGDGADLVLLQLVGEEEGSEVSSDAVTGRRRQADRREAFAASLGPVAATETEEAPVEEAPVEEPEAVEETPVEEPATEAEASADEASGEAEGGEETDEKASE
tara:strand:- start:7425 stop:8168 length:744 start_codon:yes stop_codon:yes gene_type:complete